MVKVFKLITHYRVGRVKGNTQLLLCEACKQRLLSLHAFNTIWLCGCYLSVYLFRYIVSGWFVAICFYKNILLLSSNCLRALGLTVMSFCSLSASVFVYLLNPNVWSVLMVLYLFVYLSVFLSNESANICLRPELTGAALVGRRAVRPVLFLLFFVFFFVQHQFNVINKHKSQIFTSSALLPPPARASDVNPPGEDPTCLAGWWLTAELSWFPNFNDNWL